MRYEQLWDAAMSCLKLIFNFSLIKTFFSKKNLKLNLPKRDCFYTRKRDNNAVVWRRVVMNTAPRTVLIHVKIENVIRN